MNRDQQSNVLIQFLYYALIVGLCIFFFRYLFPMLLPFIIGFAIAFLLHPIIQKLSTHGHQKMYSSLVIVVFYSVLASCIVWISMKGFYYIQTWMNQLPFLYDHYITPYLHSSLTSVESVWKSFDKDSAQVITTVLQSLQNSLSTLVNNLSKSMLTFITNFMASIPNFILSFFFAVLSSFFFNADYTNMINFLKRTLPKNILYAVNSTQHFLRTTMKKMLIAYAKLMCLTFLELSIGLYIVGVDHVLWIALGIAVFDIIPILGTGGIMLPWILVLLLSQQHKQGVGLLILYLVITLIRNIVEPKIVGKQIGLHPLCMLLSMYVGGKFMGALGIFLLPILLLIVQHLWNEKKERTDVFSLK